MWLSDALDMELAKDAVCRHPRRIATNTKVQQSLSNGDNDTGHTSIVRLLTFSTRLSLGT